MYILIGNYGSTNIGDEAILHGILKKLKNVTDKIIVLSHNIDYTKKSLKDLKLDTKNIEVYNIIPTGIRSFLRQIFSKDFWKTLKYIKKSDKIIFGGGGLLQDDEIKAIWIWSFIFFVCYILNKNIEYKAVSIGPLNHKISRYLTNIIINKSKFFSIRDNNIPYYIKNKHKISFEEDHTFNLNFENDYGIIKENKNNNNIVIGISLRNHKNIDNKFINNINIVLNNLLKKYENIKFIGLPFETHNSNDISILSKLDIKNYKIIKNKTTVYEILKELSNIDILIGMRLHSILLAKKLNIPIIPIIYSHKINFFIQSDVDICKLNIKTFNKEYFSMLIEDEIKKQLNK